VPTLDDEQFERFLKEFRPLPAPESLQLKKHPRAVRRPFVLTAWAAACTAVLVLALPWLPHRFKPTQPPGASGSGAIAPPLTNSQSLTIGRANAILADAPPFKEAVDRLSFQHQPVPQSEGKQSVLNALGKENFKL